MDVRIGVTNNPKEIGLEMPDGTDVEALQAEVDKALSKGTPLWLTDRKGRQVAIPADKIAYVELGRPDDRRIGFGG